MAIVCDERDVVGISVHQYEGDLIILEFFGFESWWKKQTFFATMNFAIFTSIENHQVATKTLTVSNLRPEIMRRSSSMYCSLKLFFGWLCYWSFGWRVMLNSRPAQVIRKKDEELFGAFGGAQCEGPGWIVEAFLNSMILHWHFTTLFLNAKSSKWR